MNIRVLQPLPFSALLVLLVACSSGNGESAKAASASAPPTIRVPDVLPGSGSRTTIKTPLPGGITPSFEYTVVAEVAAGANTTSVALETPLGAREALDRLTEQFTAAGFASTGIIEQRKRKTNELTGYAATFSASPDQPDVGGVTAMASDREDKFSNLVLLVRTP